MTRYSKTFAVLALGLIAVAGAQALTLVLTHIFPR